MGKNKFKINKKKMLPFAISDCPAGPLDCKIGGIPYYPKDMEWPLGKCGASKDKPLVFLAQFNMAYIPSIPNFPKRGILQFFISEEMYGKSPRGERKDDQLNFRVVYHQTVKTDASVLMSENDVPISNLTLSEDVRFPVKGSYLLTPGIILNERMPSTDYRAKETFLEYYNQQKGQDAKDIPEGYRQLFENLYPIFRKPIVSLGGFPSFVQGDIRSNHEEYRKYDTTILVISSDPCPFVNGKYAPKIAWGDDGCANFMMPIESLKKKDFSQVLYDWDCY